MKVDKVLWASSPEYSDFWNVNSMVHNQLLGVECVLLFYGKKSDYNLSEKYGTVIECEFESPENQIPQLVWNKWQYTSREPETTWLIGDIDQIPLQKFHFIDQVKDVPDDYYVHLAEDAFTLDWRFSRERLVGHYHVAKGKVFSEALNLSEKTLTEHVDTMVETAKSENKPIWAYEEWYTADLIKKNNYIEQFQGFNRPFERKICRSTECSYDPDLVGNNHYVDIHCPRPYSAHSGLINYIIDQFWQISTNHKHLLSK
tara:strand:+ start:10203 stop:10976 length:774 start_codon:yes stop_codon:yes gene_type:complete